jgi:hypothetical protein
MSIEVISLSHLQTDLNRVLNDCCDSGRGVVVELPDHRMVTIQPIEPDEDDLLVDNLIESNAAFRSLLEKSKSSPRKPFSDHRPKAE